MSVTYADFEKVDIRVGVIIEVENFPQAHKPAYKLKIDFGGDIGVRKSSAQITEHYKHQDLVGKQVMAVVNFPPRQIGSFISEVLTLGVPDDKGRVVLVSPDTEVPVGGNMF